MRKSATIIVVMILLPILLGCAPQAQPVQPIQPNPQPTEAVPPSRDNIETSVTATVVEPAGKIAFVRDLGGNLGWDIFTADADGKNIIDITNQSGDESWPSWSPDGTQMVFVSYRYDVATMDADGNNIKSLTSGGCPAWSPDGNKIAFSTGKLGGTVDLFTMNTDGTNQIAISPITRSLNTGLGSSQLSASWFPDSHKIAYVSNNTGKWEIQSITSDNPKPNILTPDTSKSKTYHACEINGRFGSWFPVLAVSPDGKSIAFDCKNTDGKHDMYLLSVDDKSIKCLTCKLSANCYSPAWSPDGSRIAFTIEINDNSTGHIETNIYIMNADSSNPTLLIKDGMFPVWSRQ